MSGFILEVTEHSGDSQGLVVPTTMGVDGPRATARSPLAIAWGLPLTFLIAVVVVAALFVGLLRVVLRTASQVSARALKQVWP